jgi:hypothetical protein
MADEATELNFQKRALISATSAVYLQTFTTDLIRLARTDGALSDEALQSLLDQSIRFARQKLADLQVDLSESVVLFEKMARVSLATGTGNVGVLSTEKADSIEPLHSVCMGLQHGQTGAEVVERAKTSLQ